MSDSITVKVNGEDRELPAGSTVQDLAGILELPEQRVAIERNRDVVRRVEWPSVELSSGDVIEVVHFVGGG